MGGGQHALRRRVVALGIGVAAVTATLPSDAPLYAHDVWDYERAVDYMEKVGFQARDVAESEVTRYLGWWGQAISYKVGEREILDIRGQVERAGEFDRREFHRQMLEAGAIRLDHLRQALS